LIHFLVSPEKEKLMMGKKKGKKEKAVEREQHKKSQRAKKMDKKQKKKVPLPAKHTKNR